MDMKTVLAETGLRHMSLCADEDCQDSACSFLKPRLAHTRRCSQSRRDDKAEQNEETSASVNTTCSECIEYWEIVKLHAKACADLSCPVDKCKLFRPSNMRRKLMTKMALSASGSSAATSSVSSPKGSKDSLVIDAGSLPHSSPRNKSRSDGDERADHKPSSGVIKSLKSVNSFISVGSDHMVPVLNAEDAFSNVTKHQTPLNMENPMYADEVVPIIPRAQRPWWWCGV